MDLLSYFDTPEHGVLSWCLLQKLVLQKQESLSSLSLQCHNLIDVDLTECESLTNAVCEVFSDGGGCPMLRSLILDNCEVWQFYGHTPLCHN
jgi:hypothetical protein